MKSKINIFENMKSQGEYDWKFSTIGGMTRVNICSGEDIAHLDELDQKLWTVLSCPVDGLEFDRKTLDYIDADKDGNIHVKEVVAAAKWLTAVIKDRELLTQRQTSVPLAAFDTGNEEGKLLHDTAKQILVSLGVDRDYISVEDVSDSMAIFAKTRFNGDGIITAATTDDEALKKLIKEIIVTTGSVIDRSGESGINTDLLNSFYAAAADYKAWMDAAESGKVEIFPYQDNTEAAFTAYNSIKAKIDDFFMRCSLASFSPVASLDVAPEKIAAIREKNLSDCTDEIAEYPIAKVNDKAELSLTEGINPAWKGTFSVLKKLVLDVEFPGAESITKEQWDSLSGKFAAYQAWKGAKKGDTVESLGYDRVKAIIAADTKDALLGLIAEDKALETQAGSIESVDKLLYLCRDFYTFLRNYVSFTDFYARHENRKAIFQAGTLFIDQRSCDLCIKVRDMGAHNTFSAYSGMFIIYCDCVYKKTGEKMSIAAILTDGDINNIKVGKHAIFYDCAGRDFDATVTKIIDNPISVRQAFWTPYRKIGDFIEKQATKLAADQDSKVVSKATDSIGNAKLAEKTPDAKQPFDIAKFCGLFAVIGMALGTIASFILSLFTSFFKLAWWQMPLVIIAILLLISGPSMILAWLKLRKRNLAPLLNANGWAVNAKSIVNVRFGKTLTSIAKTPLIKTPDPYAAEKMPVWKKVLLWAVLVIGLLAAVYFIIPADKRPLWDRIAGTPAAEEVVDVDVTEEIAEDVAE